MQNLNTKVDNSNKYQLNRIYYQINPANSREYRTITYSWNVFTKSFFKPFISNYVVGKPTSEMIPVSDFHLSQIMRMQDQPYF